MQASSFVATLQEVFIIIVCPKTVTFFVYTVTDSSTFRWEAGGGRGAGVFQVLLGLKLSCLYGWRLNCETVSCWPKP